MGLNTREHLTRWEKYRVSVLDVSPASDSMRNVVDYISHIAGKNGKNGKRRGVPNAARALRFFVPSACTTP